VKLKLTIGESTNAPAPAAETAPAQPDEAMQRAQADPGVQRYQELFPNSKARVARDLKE
jgi:hypothetical protein